MKSITKLAAALRVPAASLLLDGKDVVPGKLVEILLVEDDPAEVELTLEALRSINLVNRVQVVRDGAEALDFLAGFENEREHPTRARPHLILLDLGLPKMDGLDVLRQIKANPHTREIPVVVLAASSRGRDIQTSKQLGADGIIVKPVDIQTICELTPQLSLQWALLSPATVTAG